MTLRLRAETKIEREEWYKALIEEVSKASGTSFLVTDFMRSSLSPTNRNGPDQMLKDLMLAEESVIKTSPNGKNGVMTLSARPTTTKEFRIPDQML